MLERNSTNFSSEVLNYLKKKDIEAKTTPGAADKVLKYYQNLVRKYVVENDKLKGILAYHGTGYGKSFLATGIAEDMLGRGYEVLVILSKSLQANFRKNVREYKRMIGKDPEDMRGYSYVSINASNMLEKLEELLSGSTGSIDITGAARAKKVVRAKETEEEEGVGIQRNVGRVSRKRLAAISGSLKKKLVIIDEAHLFFKSITNGSKNARGLHDLIMKSDDCKVLFLTGTPLEKNPFEAVPCFNMLSKMNKGITLFSEDYNDFYEQFVQGNRMKNRDKFIARISGLVSYYGDLIGEGLEEERKVKDEVTLEEATDHMDGTEDVAKIKALLPEQLPTIFHNVPMTPAQYIAYEQARDKEKEELSRASGKRSMASLTIPKGFQSSTYRIKSRQASNVVVDLTKKGFGISPKVKKAVDNIEKDAKEGRVTMLYSQFLAAGVLSVAQELQERGFEMFRPDEKVVEKIKERNKAENKAMSNHSKKTREAEEEEAPDDLIEEAEILGGAEEDEAPEIIEKVAPRAGNGLRYAIISGEVPAEVREAILEEFNKEDNKEGSSIAVLLVTATGAIGLDLKSVRAVHILEPYWNYALIIQIIARAVRINSHVYLSRDMWKVQPYIYFSDYPESEKPKNEAEKLSKGPTTDQELYQKSVDMFVLLSDFMSAYREGAFDCLYHNMKVNKNIGPTNPGYCKVCAPNNRTLFLDKINEDMKVPCPCTKYEETDVSVKEIVVDGKKYYYKVEMEGGVAEVTIYEERPELGGFVEVDPRSAVWLIIRKEIDQLESI
nr:helicase D6/D11 putative [Kaumoebavirus]